VPKARLDFGAQDSTNVRHSADPSTEGDAAGSKRRRRWVTGNEHGHGKSGFAFGYAVK